MSAVAFWDKIKSAIVQEKSAREVKYEIVSVLDGYQNTGQVHLAIHVKGTAKTFVKPLNELYQRKWLAEFSKEDVAYIGFLYAAEEAGNLPLIEYFPRKKQIVTKNVVILGMLFISFLIASNLTAFKVAEIHLPNFFHLNVIDFPAALIFFPMTYFFDDTLTEVYGFKMSRLIIWGGLICNTIFTVCVWATVYLPVSPVWDANTHHGSAAYSLIFSGSLRILLASALGYSCGELLNSVILAKLKVLTAGRYFFLRVLGSTAVGVGIDSVLFSLVAFWHIMPLPTLYSIILTQYLFKLSYEVIMLPVTYALTTFLKQADNVDYYDFKTKFNPFSLSLAD